MSKRVFNHSYGWSPRLRLRRPTLYFLLTALKMFPFILESFSNYHFIIFLLKQKPYFVQQFSFSANFLFPISQQFYTSRIETFRLYLDTVLGKLSRI
jgi:hypothetical protein